jgi:hypothetical protein
MDTDHCTTCGKSLINVDAAILDSGWYCPDCVQPKYQWFVAFGHNKTKLVGPFQNQTIAYNWAAEFADSNWIIVEATPPDFS